jgi:subtilisin
MNTLSFRAHATVLLVASSALTACIAESTRPPADGPVHVAAASNIGQSGAQSGHRQQMRRALRDMPDADFRARTEAGGMIVIVGFRHPSAESGVDDRGRSLVGSDSAQAYSRRLRSLSSRVVYEFRTIPAVAVQVRNAEAANRLRRLPWVDYVQPNTKDWSHDQAGEGDGIGPICANLTSPQETGWNVTKVGANNAWTYATGSSGKLLVLDDGINLTLSTADLTVDAVVRPPGHSGFTAEGSHGTLVAGTAAARNNSVGLVGVAPGAHVVDGIISQSSDQLNWQPYAAQLIDGASSDVKVISMSYSSKLTNPDPPSGFVALHDVINNAVYNRGMLVVASTGNQSSPDIYSYPAQFYEVIGVGGSNSDDQWVFNNYAGGNVDLVAPAQDVPTLCNGGSQAATVSGTSFSTPQVAAALMLLRERFPAENYDKVRQRLSVSSVQLGGGVNPQTGWGRLDVVGLVNLVQVTISGPATLPSPGQYTWTANAQYGDGTYAYQWWGYDAYLEEYTVLGTSAALTLTADASWHYTQLQVVVSSQGHSWTAFQYVTRQY